MGEEKSNLPLDESSQLEASSSTSAVAEKERQISTDAANAAMSSKPNYVYINTGDEDSMVVQLVLAMRMGKRELILDKPKEKAPEPKQDEEKSELDEATTDKPEGDEKFKTEGESKKDLTDSEETKLESSAMEVDSKEESEPDDSKKSDEDNKDKDKMEVDDEVGKSDKESKPEEQSETVKN